jgi:SNF2 family DNA or RNA helicase
VNKFNPRKYQWQAMQFLISRPHAGLFLDMGLGKTAISLGVIDTLNKPRTLLIAPIRVLYTTWPDEMAKWGFDIRYANLHENREMLYTHDADIYGINPESSLHVLKDPRFLLEHFDLLIIDESSMYKAHDSQRFKLLRKHLHRFGKRWILTGTPAPNSLIDVWSQIFLLDRGQSLGEFITRFRNAFCLPDWSGFGYRIAPGAEPEIYNRIKPLVLRMEAKDYIDMPELVYNNVPVALDKAARKMYTDMENDFLLRLEEDVVMSPNAAAAGMRCRQIANGGVYLPTGKVQHIHNAKTEALKELVEELQGRPVIVFYEFLHDTDRIKSVLGDVPTPTPETIRQFAAGKIPIMMGHPASMGYGLNLQDHCDTVIWYGIPWDLGAYDQAIARVWRSGQKSKKVVVHHIVAKDTLDETVLSALAQKSKTQKTLLDAMKRRSHDHRKIAG